MGTNNIQGNSGPRLDYRPELNNRRSEGIRSGGPDRQVRAATGEVSSEKTRTLELTTDDGDTVTISIETSAQLQAEGLIARGPNGRARGGDVSADFSASVSVEVTGELDADEVKDIGKLLRDLAANGGNPAPKPAEPPPVVEGGPVVTAPPLPGETGEVPPAPVETAPPATDAPPILEAPPLDELPPADPPPPSEEDGTTIASYTYSVESDVQGSFSRLHNPETYG